jgi:DNA-binding MarR family transcriptional regulator
MRDISTLFEIFPFFQKMLMNTVNSSSVDLTKTQMLILFALSGDRSLHMSQVAAYIACSKEQATRAVAPLVKRGLVNRYRKEDNRKRVFISLTKEGQEFLEAEKAFVKEQISSRFATLPPEDQQRFHDAITDILTILKKLDDSFVL